MEPAVTCLHQFVIRHVEQIAQLRLPQLLDKTSGQIPNRCRRHRLPDEMRQSGGAPPSRFTIDEIVKTPAGRAGVGVPIGHIR